jgi:AcrR family transcriptional regulator
MLAEGGYDTLSIEQVADRAGVHKTTVYRRWPTKLDLVVDATRERSREHVPVPDTGTFAGDLRALARSVAANLRSPRVRTMTSNLVAAAATSPELSARTHEFWAERLEMTRRVVDRAVARGEIAATSNHELIIEALVGPLYLRLLLTGEAIDDDTADRIAELVAAGAAGTGTGPVSERR